MDADDVSEESMDSSNESSSASTAKITESPRGAQWEKSSDSDRSSGSRTGSRTDRNYIRRRSPSEESRDRSYSRRSRTGSRTDRNYIRRRSPSEESRDRSYSRRSRSRSSTVAISTLRRVQSQESMHNYCSYGSQTISNEEQSFSESETEEKGDDDERLNVEGSIHRLCINKLPQLFSPVPKDMEEEMIHKLVKKFNDRKKSGVYAGKFQLEINKNLSKNPGSVDKLCEQLPENNFQNLLYVSQRHRRVPPILKYHGSKRKCGPIHLCWFFYRPGEIFAFTTNQGYRLVHDYSEFDFPNKIAARLCTDKGFKVSKKRLLVGQDWQEAKTSKSSERPSTGDLPSLYSTFTCELRPNSSIGRVARLSQSSKNVEFKACTVRFASKLKIIDLPKIFNHLSTIAKGLPTYAYMPPPETSEEAEQGGQDSALPETQETLLPEISSTVYDCYLVPVGSRDFYNELDLQVADKFRLAVTSGNWDQFTFDLGHKYHNDYALATKVELRITFENHRKKPVRLSSSPSLKEVWPYLVDFDFSSCDAYDAWKILKEDLRIRYTISPKKPIKEPLLSFLEGELFYNNKVYWRAGNNWYEPMSTYVAESDKLFIEFLQQHYKDGHLMKAFSVVSTPQRGERDCVREYAQQYEGISGYFLPDPSTWRLLFDLMHVGKQRTIRFYFIVCNFMAHTSDLCGRVNNCFEAIKAACEDRKGPLRSFYDGIEDPQRQARLGESFEEFQNRLKESRIIYALAPSSVPTTPGSLCSRTFTQEKDREVKITPGVLVRHMERLSYDDVKTICGTPEIQNRRRAIQATSRLVHEILQTEGYIDRTDMVTAKFLYSTPRPFIWTYKLSRFQSGFKSLRARFELRYIAQRKVYSTSFHVMDIENQVQMEVEY